MARIKQSVTESRKSTKPVVGEIDTNSPIQSVKDAVSLFGEASLSAGNLTIKKAKSKAYSVEVILVLYLFVCVYVNSYDQMTVE